MKALLNQKLLPVVFSGTSAGALVAAMVCVRTDEELRELLDDPSLYQHFRPNTGEHRKL